MLIHINNGNLAKAVKKGREKKTKTLNKTKIGFFFNPETESQFHSIYEHWNLS